MKKSRMVVKFDPCGALMINRSNRILILFHLYCWHLFIGWHFDSKHNSSFLRIFISIIILFNVWIITLMEDSKHDLSTINMLYSLKMVILHPLPPHTGNLSTTATFFCPQGNRCGEVRRYLTILVTITHLQWLLVHRFLRFRSVLQNEAPWSDSKTLPSDLRHELAAFHREIGPHWSTLLEMALFLLNWHYSHLSWDHLEEDIQFLHSLFEQQIEEALRFRCLEH